MANLFYRMTVKTMFFFLRRGLVVLSHMDSGVKREVEAFPEGYTIALGVCRGPEILLKKTGGQLGKLKKAQEERPHIDVDIQFKSIQGAFLVVTGQIGVDVANAQHRFTLKGDINQAMGVVRCMTRAERYLFPKFMAKKILKRLNPKEVSSALVYLRVLFTGR